MATRIKLTLTCVVAMFRWAAVCGLPSVVAARGLCKLHSAEKMQGVNIDNSLFDDHLDDATVGRPQFFEAPAGVHN